MAAFAVVARVPTAGPFFWWAVVALCILNHIVFSVRTARALALALGIRIFHVKVP
jgi:hypothetical protein